MYLNEADTCAQLIDPRLNVDSWARSQATRMPSLGSREYIVKNYPRTKNDLYSALRARRRHHHKNDLPTLFRSPPAVAQFWHCVDLNGVNNQWVKKLFVSTHHYIIAR